MSGRIKISISKPSKDTLLGVGFQDEDGMVIVAGLQNTSPFYGTIELGYQILSINGVSMAGKTSVEAANMLKEAEGKVTVEGRKLKIPLKPIVASVVESNIEVPLEEEEDIHVSPQEEEEIHVSTLDPTFDAEAPSSEPAKEVQFEAPSDLPEGYALEAEVGDDTYVAIVPPGGVQQGDLLTAHLKISDTQPAAAPPMASAVPADPEPLIVEFVCPCDLPENYEVEVEIDGQPRIAIVPPGGAREGETVTATVVPLSEAPLQPPSPGYPPKEEPQMQQFPMKQQGALMPVPQGRWRNELCDCCSHCGRPAFWVSWCFGPVSLGQIMTRMNLNWCGDSEPSQDESAFRFMLVATICFLVYFAVFIGLAYYIAIIALVAFNIFVLVMMIRTRAHIRQKYGIQGSALEDCCLSYWCGCCTAIQMASHTADFNQYESQCCTPTGLGRNAPPNQHLQLSGAMSGGNEEKLKRRKMLWALFGGILLIFIIVSIVVAAVGGDDSSDGVTVSTSSSGGVRGGGSSGGSSCSWGYKYCYVYKCKNQYSKFGSTEYIYLDLSCELLAFLNLHFL